MFIRKKEDFIKYENGSWQPLFHFNFQGQSRPEKIFQGYSNLFAFSDDRFGNDFEFPMHEHQAFLIGTYVIDGVLEHQDSTNESKTLLSNGDFQFTDAAHGVHHSETPITSHVHSIQMWFLPDHISLVPSYSTIRHDSYKEDGKYFIESDKLNADLKIAVLNTDKDFVLGEHERNNYIYVIEGKLELKNGEVLTQEVLVLEREVLKINNNKSVKLLILSLPSLVSQNTKI